MPKANIQSLLDLLEVRVEAFAMCEIADQHALTVPPLNELVVHFVLQGEGAIACEHGEFPLRTGSIAVIPRKLQKQINGRGAVLHVVDAGHGCPLVPGLISFRAGQIDPQGLVLGCASVSADLGQGLGLFDHLQQPLVEAADDEILPMIFAAVHRELARPGVGTKPIIDALMKQILVLIVRNHLKKQGLTSPLYLPLMNPQLGRVLTAMVAHPEHPHSLESLAAIAGMSRSRFTHHFSATYGRSPMEYLHLIRLRAAARLLRSSTMPVKSIAAAVGFASRSHFSRAFRTRFGADPTSFRDTQPGELTGEEQMPLFSGPAAIQPPAPN